MRISAAILAIAALGVAAPAMAQTSPADAPVATANSTSSSPLTTPQQIEHYLATSPAIADETPDGAAEPRRIHGEVGVAVGTGDYRSGYAIVSIPLGETGQLDLAYSQTKNGGYVYPGYGYDYAAPLPMAAPMGGPASFSSGCPGAFSDGERAIVTDRGGALRVSPERCPMR